MFMPPAVGAHVAASGLLMVGPQSWFASDPVRYGLYAFLIRSVCIPHQICTCLSHSRAERLKQDTSGAKVPLLVPQRRVLDLAVVSTWSLAVLRRATERPGSRVKISSFGENVQWTSLRHQNSRSCGSLRDCRPGCGSSLTARLVKMLAAADHGLDGLAAFLNPEPSRGSVHDQRDVAPSLQHREHSVVDAVTERCALELPFALRCMYREKPANVAVTHAVTLARKRGAERCRFRRRRCTCRTCPRSGPRRPGLPVSHTRTRPRIWSTRNPGGGRGGQRGQRPRGYKSRVVSRGSHGLRTTLTAC